MNDTLYLDEIVEDGLDFYSGALSQIGYDREGKNLYIEFHSGGEYVYSDVEESTYNLLKTAPSVGVFYRNHIQGKYTSDRFWDVFGNLAERETTPEDEPVAINVTIDPSDASQFTLNNNFMSTITIQPSRFSVRWNSDSFGGAGPFEAEYQAMSEADALAQFEGAIKATGIADYKVLAVTHYF